MKEKQIRIGDRIHGLLGIALFTGTAAAIIANGNLGGIEKTLMGCLGLIGTAEGFGDLITGQNHYLSLKIINYVKEKKNRRYLL